MRIRLDTGARACAITLQVANHPKRKIRAIGCAGNGCPVSIPISVVSSFGHLCVIALLLTSGYFISAGICSLVRTVKIEALTSNSDFDRESTFS